MAGFYIPEQSDDANFRSNYFEVTDATSAQVLAATLGQTLYENPLASAVRTIDYLANRNKGRQLSAQEWEESEFFREGLSVPAEGVNEGAASILAERYDQRELRNLVLQRSPGGIGLGAAQLGVGLLGSALDPLNVAASFIPVVGQARFLASMQKHGRTVARLRKGAAEGAIGATAVEPLVLTSAFLEQNEDYTYATAFMNVAFGTVLGGGLQAGAGRISDALQRANPKTVQTLQQNAIAKTVQGQEIEQNLTVRQDPVLRNDPVFRDVTDVRQGDADLPALPPKKGKAFPKSLKAAYRKEARPETLKQFIRRQGGILPDDPNAQDFVESAGNRDLLKKSRKLKGKPLPPDRKSLDKMREAAEEEGYLPEGSSIEDFLELVRQETGGRPVYPPSEMQFDAELESALAIKDELERYGIDPKGYTDEQIDQVLEYYRRIDEVPEEAPAELTEDDYYELRAREAENLGKSLDVKDFEARMQEAEEVARRFDTDDELERIRAENEALEDDIRYFIDNEQLPQEVQNEIAAYVRLEQKADQGYAAALKAAENCVPGEI